MNNNNRARVNIGVYFPSAIWPAVRTVAESTYLQSRRRGKYDEVKRAHRGPYYRKRGSASYIVREVLLVREREIQRERETEVTSPLSR